MTILEIMMATAYNVTVSLKKEKYRPGYVGEESGGPVPGVMSKHPSLSGSATLSADMARLRAAETWHRSLPLPVAIRTLTSRTYIDFLMNHLCYLIPVYSYFHSYIVIQGC